MATVTGQPMEKIVNWFMLLIIFVFDPLAIAMVVAANMAFAHIKGVSRDPKDYEVYQSKVITKEVPIEKEDIEKFNPEFETKYSNFIRHLKNNNIKIPKKFQ